MALWLQRFAVCSSNSILCNYLKIKIMVEISIFYNQLIMSKGQVKHTWAKSKLNPCTKSVKVCSVVLKFNTLNYHTFVVDQDYY